MDHTKAKQAQDMKKKQVDPNDPVYPPEQVPQLSDEPKCCCGCDYEGTTTTCAVLNCCPFGCSCWPCSIFYCCIGCQGRNPNAAYAASICNTVLMWVYYVASGLNFVKGIKFLFKKPIPIKGNEYFHAIEQSISEPMWDLIRKVSELLGLLDSENIRFFNVGIWFLLLALWCALLGYLFQYMAEKYSEFEEHLKIEEKKREVDEGSNL